MRKLLPVLAAAAMACNGSSHKSTPTKVALFINDSYVDYRAGSVGSEAYDMERALAVMSGVKTTTIGQLGDIAGSDVFVLPEQENASLEPDLDSTQLTLIHDFVTGGKTMILAYPGSGYQDVVNSAFELGLTEAGGGEGPTGDVTLTAAAASTRFAGGSATLTALSATTVVTAASLPSDATIIYADGNGDAVVAVIPQGSGRIVLLGWDFYDAAPFGSADDGWLDVLETAVKL